MNESGQLVPSMAKGIGIAVRRGIRKHPSVSWPQFASLSLPILSKEIA